MKIQRDGALPVDEAKNIMLSLLETLHYLHNVHHLLHNDVTPRNVMIAPDGQPKLIDMGHLSGLVLGVPHFDVSDLDLHYCSTPSMAGLYTPMNDIFAAVAVFYTMLTGHAPWPVDLDSLDTRAERVKAIRVARRDDPDMANVPKEYHHLIYQGLNCDDDRFETVRQVMYEVQHPTVEHNDEPADTPKSTNSRSRQGSRRDSEALDKTDIEIKRGGGNGFADIAGMAEMKEMLQKRVWATGMRQELLRREIRRRDWLQLHARQGFGFRFGLHPRHAGQNRRPVQKSRGERPHGDLL